MSSAAAFRMLCNKQCGPRPDCSSWRRLIWIHTVCLYVEISNWQNHTLVSRQQMTPDDTIFRCIISQQAKGFLYNKEVHLTENFSVLTIHHCSNIILINAKHSVD